jgi:hypothetical protein
VYDNQGRLKALIYSDSDNELEKLQFYSKYEYTYDAEGRPESDNHFYWDPIESNWVKTRYREFGFDENDRLKAHKEYWWNEAEAKFISTEFNEFAYNEQGHLLHIINKVWSTEEQKWIDIYLTENEYDERGNLIFRTNSYRDNYSGEWYPVEREALTYDNQVPCLAVFLPFDAGFNSYEVLEEVVDYEIYENFYDPARIKEIVYYEFNFPDIVNFPERVDAPVWKERQYWDPDSLKWDIGSTMEFFISTADFVINAPETKTGDRFIIYPNPVVDYLNFKFPDGEEQIPGTQVVSIYDLTGRKVMEMKSGGAGSVNVSELGSGLFIFEVSRDGKKYRRIFVKS